VAYTYEQLRKLSTADLIREHDARTSNVVMGLGYFQEEIVRRENTLIARHMFWMTLAITACTIVMTVLTAVLVRRA